MKKFILALALTVITSLGTLAQSSGDDYKKTEFFVGYSFGRANANFGGYVNKTGLDGFNASGVVNVHRYIGIKADVSGTFNKRHFSLPAITAPVNPPSTVSFDGKNSLYNFLGGVQFKDNASEKRFNPFAHALIGAAHRKSTITVPIICLAIIACPGNSNETGLAGAFGGGLDVRVNSRVSFRAVQVDYNPIKFNRGIDHNMRFSSGIVF